jgi:hypothetical protein
MRTLAMLGMVACLLGPAVGVVGAQGPASQPSAAKAPSGILRGRVLAADSGAGLPRARVGIIGNGTGAPRRVSTDAAGAWEFKGVAPGRYTITVTRPPYITLEYGQKNALVPGTPVELAEGQTIDKLDVRLPRGSVISGRVIDDLGDPAGYVTVNAVREQFLEGRRQLVRTGMRAVANDLGYYRLYGLPPGAYYLLTDSVAWSSSAAEDAGVSFAATFHPSSASSAAAQAVTVRAGQELPGVDIRQVATHLARLAGIVTEADGTPATAGTVTLYEDLRAAAGGSLRSAGSAPVQGGGRFAINGVAPGDYVLEVRRPASGPGAGVGGGRMPLTVAGEDIEGLAIPLLRGSTVVGQVQFEGGDPPPVTPLTRVWAYEAVPAQRGSSGVSTIGADWSFELQGVWIGMRVVRMTGLPEGYFLKAVLVEGDDVIDEPRAFDGKGTLSGVRLLVSNKVTTVAGTVAEDDGKPAKDYSVVLFSTDQSKWGPGSRRRTTARPDQNGRFSATGLPGGEYFAVAVDVLLAGEGEDPQFLSELRDRAVRFTLAEGEQQSLALRLARLERQ